MEKFVPQPKIIAWRNGIPEYEVNGATRSGFTELENVRHCHYMQFPHGFTQAAGNEPAGWMDREGRMQSKSYCFQLAFPTLGEDAVVVVHVHEHGRHFFLDFQNFAGTLAAPAVIESDPLPVSLRPASRTNGVINVGSGGVDVIGSYLLEPTGVITIYGGPLAEPFVAGATAVKRFFIAYDRLVPAGIPLLV